MKVLKPILLVAMLLGAGLHSGCGRDKPPFSPEQALERFQLPPGLRIELVAAEPEIVDPVAMAFDEKGRLYVVEMPDYPLSLEAPGKVKLLEDGDGDGRFERSTVFAEELSFPNGVMPWRDGILVTAAPDILYFEDTDGDNRADVRKVILTGFAYTNPQLRVNGLLYGLDNWIYAAYRTAAVPRHYVKEFGDIGEAIRFPDHPEAAPAELAAMRGMDVRFRMDPPKVEPVAGNSQFGNAFDPWGNRFTVWNNDHIRHVVIQNRYLSRNPHLPVSSAMKSASGHGNAADVYSIAEDFVEVHEQEMGHFTSACGISVYTGDKLPQQYAGNFFVCEPVHHIVHRDIIGSDGPTFVAKRAHGGKEFLGTTDGWFSPVFTTTGPDGALYVVDFYRQTVEHPEYAHDLLHELDFDAGTRQGRIYRIVPESFAPGAPPRLDQASASQLVEQLSNPNMWWRTTAQRLLVGRNDKSAIPMLQELARQGSPDVARAHALWTLQGMGALDTELVLMTLEHENPALREQAVRLAELRLEDSKVRAKLLEMAADPDVRVQFQVACSLGDLPPEQSFRPLQQIAMRHLDSEWFQIAALSSAAETADRWFQAVLSDRSFLGEKSPGKEEFLSRITSILGSRQKSREIGAVLAGLNRVSGEPATWWRTAGLKGLTTGLERGKQRRAELTSAGQRELLKLLDASSPEVKQAALQAAEQLELKESPQLRSLLRKAAHVAQDENSGLDARVYATGVLGLDPTTEAVPLLERLVNPQEPEPIQVAAVASLARKQDVNVNTLLLENWRTYTGPVREAALRAFFRDPSQLPGLLDAIEAGKIQPWSLSAGRRRQLLRSSDERVRDRARTLLADVSGEDRRKVFEKYLPAAESEGDASRGKQVFEGAACVECHKVGEQGFDVGPDLLAVTHRPKKQLLRDILMPNETLEAGYEEYVVETTDGRLISGVIGSQTPTTLTLRRAKGEQDTIARDTIAELRSLSVSPMPEDLENEISVEAMADLLAYLKSL